MKYMKEIGGYFEFENLISNEYYSNLVALSNARSGLAYLIRGRHIQKIYIPYFLCSSVISVLIRENVEYEYYHINKKLLPIFDVKLKENEYLYFVNYFGQFDNEIISKLKEKFNNIIVDNVQAFFQNPLPNVDTIYSCRKYFGVPDGCYLSTSIEIHNIPRDISINRFSHLLGRYEGGRASDYYSDYLENEKEFDKLEIRKMSKITHNILGAIDYEAVINKRNINYSFYGSILNGINRFNVKKINGPFVYPFFCDDGMKIKKKLIKEKIYVATYWPNVLEYDNTLEKEYAENIIPLPCDQRYGIEELTRVTDCLLSIL